MSIHPKVQSALVSLNPATGEILALVGGYNFRNSQFNRAIQAKPQLGSNFKPFLYAAAFENGFNPASIIIDSPLVFEDKNLEEIEKLGKLEKSLQKIADQMKLDSNHIFKKYQTVEKY